MYFPAQHPRRPNGTRKFCSCPHGKQSVHWPCLSPPPLPNTKNGNPTLPSNISPPPPFSTQTPPLSRESRYPPSTQASVRGQYTSAMPDGPGGHHPPPPPPPPRLPLPRQSSRPRPLRPRAFQRRCSAAAAASRAERPALVASRARGRTQSLADPLPETRRAIRRPSPNAE